MESVRGLLVIVGVLAATPAAAEPLLIDRLEAESRGLESVDLAVPIASKVSAERALDRLAAEAGRQDVDYLAAVRIYRNLPGGWQCDAPVLFGLRNGVPRIGETGCRRQEGPVAQNDWIVARGYRTSATAVAGSKAKPKRRRMVRRRLSRKQLRELVQQLE